MAVTSFMMAGCIFSGPGALDNIGPELKRQGCKKPLVVTDKGVVTLGLCARVESVLRDAGLSYAIFSDTVPNPTDDNVMACHALYRKEECDCLIAVGGGSPMDCAKSCGVVAGGNQHINEYEGVGTMHAPLPFFVAVPTTAGTGSESTIFAVVTNTKEAHPRKFVIGDARMLPNLAIIDPSLMTGLPPAITASTGCDALTHAVECFFSVTRSEYSTAMAIHAIKLIVKYLPKAVGNGKDMEARTKMAEAQTIAGIAFSNGGLGIVHALAHPLSAFFDVAHGDANSIMLPYVLKFNQLVTQDRLVELAQLFGVHTHDMTEVEAADAALAAVRRFTHDVGIPGTISEFSKLRGLKVDRTKIPEMAADAMKDVCVPFNPRVPTQKDMEALYEEAWG